MNFKISSLLYRLTSAIMLLYVIVAFLLWFPTPLEMISQSTVDASAGVIVGLFVFPFTGLFYLTIVGTVIALALRLYDLLYDVPNNFNPQTEHLLLKRIMPFIMILTLIFFLFNNSTEEIIIKGRINSLKSYTITVKYQAKNNGFFCTEWSMWVGSHQRSKYYTYYPKIEKNEHHVKIPIDKTFFSWCNYQVKNIEIDIQNKKTILFEQKNTMTYLSPNNKQITFIKAKNNTYTLDIGKINHTRTISTTKTSKIYIENPKQIEQRRLVKIVRNQLNQLALAFHEFSSKHLRFPSYEEAKEIFSLHQALVIDPWGKPYKYEISKNHHKARLTGHVPPIIVNPNSKYKAQGSYIHVPLSSE